MKSLFIYQVRQSDQLKMPDKCYWALMLSHSEEWMGADLKGQSLVLLIVEGMSQCRNMGSFTTSNYLHLPKKYVCDGQEM